MHKDRSLLWLVPTITVFLTAWELAARLWIRNDPLFPSVQSIALAFLEMLKSGELIRDVAASVVRVTVGFTVGSVAGVMLGVLTARIAWLRHTVGPLLLFLRSIPAIALVPLAILWFGIGELAKVALVFWGVLFPVWINTYAGADKIGEAYIWAAKSLGASERAILVRVIVPGALPFILAGLRIALGLAFITLIAAEMTGAFSGIGYRLVASELIFRTDKIMADLLVLGLLGLGADGLFISVVKRCFPWVMLNDNVPVK